MIKSIVSILFLLQIIFGFAQKNKTSSLYVEIDNEHKIIYEKSYALLIGNSKYTNGWGDLSGVKEDIREVKTALTSHDFRVEVYENLNKCDMDRVFSSFIKRYGQNKNNRLLFYFAGHGYTVSTYYGDKLAYIVPKNAPLPKNDLAGFQEKSMETSQIEIYAKQIRVKHVLFIFDACFSGAMFRTDRTLPDALSENTAEAVRQFISSGSENENVPDKSIFREQFVRALTSKDADLYKDDYLTGSELGEFLQTSVVNLSKNRQHPQYGKIHHAFLNKGDFVFVMADSVLNKDKAAYGSVQLKSKIAGNLYLDKRKIRSIEAKSSSLLEKIPAGIHLIEVKGKKLWADSVWVYENKLSQVFILDEIYQNNNDWFVDSRDGNVYATVKIKKQTWMAENLNYNLQGGSYCYGDSLYNCNIYGRLYAWGAATEVCPAGWHLPEKNEWKTLFKNLGGYEDTNDFAFSQLIIGGSSDFNAIFGGFRQNFGTYNFNGFHAGFWTLTEFNKSIAEYCGLSKYGQNTTFQSGHKQLGLSVRCVKD